MFRDLHAPPGLYVRALYPGAPTRHLADPLACACREMESSPQGTLARPGSPRSPAATASAGAGIGAGTPAETADPAAAPEANGEAEAGGDSSSPSPKKGSSSTLKKQVSSAFKFFGLAAR